MSKFKIGDKVIETSTGDKGVINRQHDTTYALWFVDWITGEQKGQCLSINENSMVKIKASNKKKAKAIAKEWGYTLDALLKDLETTNSITPTMQLAAAAIIKALITKDKKQENQ